MPIKKCQENSKPGYKWGDEGKCYTYKEGSKRSETWAKKKAKKQGQAIKANESKIIKILNLIESLEQEELNELSKTLSTQKTSFHIQSLNYKVTHSGQEGSIHIPIYYNSELDLYMASVQKIWTEEMILENKTLEGLLEEIELVLEEKFTSFKLIEEELNEEIISQSLLLKYSGKANAPRVNRPIKKKGVRKMNLTEEDIKFLLNKINISVTPEFILNNAKSIIEKDEATIIDMGNIEYIIIRREDKKQHTKNYIRARGIHLGDVELKRSHLGIGQNLGEYSIFRYVK